MKKKNLIIIGSVLLLIIIALFFVLLAARKKQNQGNQQVIQNPATLPSSQAINSQNVEDIKKTIDNIVQEPIPGKVVQEGSDLVKFSDQSDKLIPLADFESATGIVINKDLRSYLDSTDYRIFYCPAGSNEKNFGLYVGYNVQKAYNDLYPDTIKWMKNWERTMFSDLHSVLFPSVNFEAKYLDQSLQFRDGKFRYAEISLPGGKTSSINYRVSDNGVIIATSPACLDKIVSIYEPLEP